MGYLVAPLARVSTFVQNHVHDHDADSNLKVLFYLRSIDYCQCRRTGALGPRHGTGILFGTQSSFCGFTHTLHQRSRSSPWPCGRRTTDKPDTGQQTRPAPRSPRG